VLRTTTVVGAPDDLGGEAGFGFAMEYSEKFKASLVRRMAGPRAVSASALEAEVGVPQPTLSRWLREAGSVGGMTDDDGKASAKTRARKAWTATEKMRVLVATSGLDDAKLGEILRREGLHSDDLQRWRDDALQGLSPGRADKKASAADRARIKELERELHRKEKALAEAAALLVLRKKLEALHWFEDDAPTDSSEKTSSRRSTKR
jgi:transposase-like protein